MLVENGDFSTVGRHAKPDVHDIAVLEEALKQQDMSGWIAVMDRSVHSRAFSV